MEGAKMSRERERQRENFRSRKKSSFRFKPLMQSS